MDAKEEKREEEAQEEVSNTEKKDEGDIKNNLEIFVLPVENAKTDRVNEFLKSRAQVMNQKQL